METRRKHSQQNVHVYQKSYTYNIILFNATMDGVELPKYNKNSLSELNLYYYVQNHLYCICI